ncbi:MAG TPA: hypothetical protein VK143_10605, partial [Burkholderiales bacterium]|nr:hypothetical protein [Burkholderiales bacterium]
MTMTRLTQGTLLVAAIMLLAVMPARAQIVNGSFEDDYMGWTLVETPPDPTGCFGTWGIANIGPAATLLPGEIGSPLLPGGSAFDFHDGVNCVQTSDGLPITFAPLDAAIDGNKLAFQ